MNPAAIRRPAGRRLALLALSGAAAFAPLSGCVTVAMWEHWPSHDGGHIRWASEGTIGAIVLTPVTIALDAALIAGFLWLAAQDDGCGCGGDSIVFHFD